MSFENRDRSDTPDLSGKNAVVTGANSGIGFEIARALASRGADVVLACRDRTSGTRAKEVIRKEAPNADVRLIGLDLGSLESIRGFAQEFLALNRSLDILCNNAGVMMCPRASTADGFELQFGTNHLGHFALTGLLLERIRQTPGARVVTMSSTFHRSGKIDFANLNGEQAYNPRAAYQQSKLANLLFCFELQRHFVRHGLSAISVAAHPGYASTRLQRHSLLFRITNVLFAQSAAMGALPALYAASASDVQGGEYFGPGGRLELRGQPTRVQTSPRARDEVVAQQLWSRSEALTGVEYVF